MASSQLARTQHGVGAARSASNMKVMLPVKRIMSPI